MLRFSFVSKRFHDPGRGVVQALDAVDLALAGGCCALVGANGAGKSTLLRLAAGLMLPDQGVVTLDGRATHAGDAALRRRVSWVSAGTRLPPRLTVREVLAFAGGCHGLAGTHLAARSDAMAALFGLGDIIDQRCGGLSTGQAQRTVLARALLPDPAILLLDEPTTGLDVVVTRLVGEALRAARGPDRLILFATHDLRQVELVADRLLVLAHGRLRHDGPPSALGAGAALESAVHALLDAAP
jgi:sodium transport system ATP-binding protein